MSSEALPNYIDPVTGEYNGPMFDEHDKTYFKVAIGLAILTAIEVVLSYTSLKGAGLALPLMGFALVKFSIVAAYFMHLKYDTPLFRRLFIGGAVLAGFCYTAALSAMAGLRTPQALLPVHWWLYLAFAIVVLGVWVVPRVGRDDHDGHDHDGHDHDGHDHDGHAAHSH